MQILHLKTRFSSIMDKKAGYHGTKRHVTLYLVYTARRKKKGKVVLKLMIKIAFDVRSTKLTSLLYSYLGNILPSKVCRKK